MSIELIIGQNKKIGNNEYHDFDFDLSLDDEDRMPINIWKKGNLTRLRLN